MLVRIPRDQDTYVNIIELTRLLIIVEFIIACETILIYDKTQEHRWNRRRIFWYTVLGAPALASVLAVVLASFKYLVG